MTGPVMTHPAHILHSLRDLDVDKIAFEVARNQCGPKHPPDVLLMDCGITDAQFVALCDDALFKRKVRDYVKELTENGTSFQLKARLLAEDLLATNYKLAKSKDTPPSVAEKLIANTVRWAGLDKKADGAPDAFAGGPKINISINLGDTPLSAPTTSVTIDAQAPQPEALPTTQGENDEHEQHSGEDV